MASTKLNLASACALILCSGLSIARATEPLVLEAKIALGSVAGRIDHLAIDLPRQRLFIAELGNDSVGIVDLKERRIVRTISGLKEPQGLGYHRPTDTLYVANAGDGSVRLFGGPDYSVAGQIDLNNDADNIRIDDATSRIFVGYGDGALAVIDPKTRSKIADIPLNAHPEGFQLAPKSHLIFANIPNAGEIAVLDVLNDKLRGNWSTGNAGGNFPMAIDETASQVITIFRSPPKLRSYSMQTGEVVNEVDICGDADDVFLDAKRSQLYVSCGAGFIDVIDASGKYKHLARLPTASGARTSLFVPELDRLFLAVRAGARRPAEIWIYRPT